MVLKKRRDHISTDSPSRMKAPKWWRVVRRVFFYGIILPVKVKHLDFVSFYLQM